jgi:1-acyl-sn-glycerol-3-phosphate acyltransferase
MAGIKQILILMHTLIVYCWTILGTLIFGLLAILTSFFSKNGNSVHTVARIWGRSILWVSGIRAVTIGYSSQMGHQSLIYMSNHQSNYDIPVLYSALPVQFRWLAKAELFKIPIFGRGMRGAGYISIDRSNRHSAFDSLAKAAASIRNGTSVMIFPEGTRSLDGRLLPYKKGGFVMAIDAGVPIVPVVIAGTHAIMPKGRLAIRRQKVQVRVGAPIETAGFTRKRKNELIEKVRLSMLEMMPESVAGEQP